VDPGLKTWSELDLYSQTMLQVGLNVPVRYHDDWIPKQVYPKVSKFDSNTKDLGFVVRYDGTDLRKPIVFRDQEKPCILQLFKLSGKNVGATGYFYAQHGTIQPKELQGLLLRIRHAAVGEYSSSFLGFPSTKGSVVQRWVSAEVWADDRLEDALNIDRRTLRVTHPAFVELQVAVHKFLDKFLDDVREKVYEIRNVERKSEKAKATVDGITTFANTKVASISRSAATELVNAWKGSTKTPDTSKRLAKKFSVVDLYRIVLEVAEEVMSPAQLKQFLRKLTKRLSGKAD
jgi:hypothetical protein